MWKNEGCPIFVTVAPLGVEHEPKRNYFFFQFEQICNDLYKLDYLLVFINIYAIKGPVFFYLIIYILIYTLFLQFFLNSHTLIFFFNIKRNSY